MQPCADTKPTRNSRAALTENAEGMSSVWEWSKRKEGERRDLLEWRTARRWGAIAMSAVYLYLHRLTSTCLDRLGHGQTCWARTSSTIVKVTNNNRFRGCRVPAKTQDRGLRRVQKRELRAEHGNMSGTLAEHPREAEVIMQLPMVACCAAGARVTGLSDRLQTANRSQLAFEIHPQRERQLAKVTRLPRSGDETRPTGLSDKHQTDRFRLASKTPPERGAYPGTV